MSHWPTARRWRARQAIHEAEAAITTLDKYNLHEEIGAGGFGKVFRATHTTLHTPAAVKVLDAGRARDERTRQRFIREAREASRLDHPHIVHILDLGEADGQMYIAMDYLPGGDLKNWQAAHGALARADLLRILGEVAAALDYAHAQRVLHRDVKPGNILLDAAGRACLGDFGLVLPPNAPHLTQIGSMVGTAAYTAPEQAEARPEIDGRADQYSLAVVAYEQIAGQVPFQGDNPTAVMLLHVTKPPPPPSQFNPDVPPEVEQVLLRALEKEPHARYADCAAFVGALGSAYRAADRRRFGELLAEARRQLETGEHPRVREALEQARALLGGQAAPTGAAGVLAAVEQELKLALRYREAVEQLAQARSKAQEALELAPDLPDREGVLVALGLRRPPVRLPAPEELLRQAGAGLLLALPLILALFALAYLWLTKR